MAQKSQVSRLSKMTKSLASRLQQSGQFYDRVLEFPLAICDEFGKMRSRNKSSFKDALLQIPALCSMFITSLPFIMTDCEVIIDGLKFVHCPPLPSITTYHQFVSELFGKMVLQHGFHRGASCVTIVFDKPEFLPRIRDTIHTERKNKTSKTSFVCPSKISDEDAIPHGEIYAEALTDSKYKSLLLDYITVSFTVLAKQQIGPDTKVIIDSPTFGNTPVEVSYQQSKGLCNRANNKGEADCAVWFHAVSSTHSQVLIHAGDTDIYMYGLALFDQGHLNNKEVAVERVKDAEYVQI